MNYRISCITNPKTEFILLQDTPRRITSLKSFNGEEIVANIHLNANTILELVDKLLEEYDRIVGDE